VTSPEVSTRVSSQLPRRGAIVTASTCALSLDRRASYAVASHQIHIIFDICSHAPWAAKRAMNSRSRSAACITGPRIAQATNAAGGRLPASIP